jgi:ssDNA-binding Zn-finger/Zn-ribbon topoisomerase 1
MSPPGSQGVLIRVVRPKLVSGRLELVAAGSKTIEYPEIKERFGHFGLTLEWKKIERIRAIRNDLEHFYHPGSVANVREALADTATVIRNLLGLLNLNPVDALGQSCWDLLIQSKQLFDGELNRCRASLAGVVWINDSAKAASPSLSCTACRSPLPFTNKQQGLGLECAACGAELDMKSSMHKALTTQYYKDLYEAYTQGGEKPVVRCPSCKHNSVYVDAGECVACGYTLGPDITWCPECHDPVLLSDVQVGLHDCRAVEA